LALRLALRRRVVRLVLLMGVLSSLAIVGWYLAPAKVVSYAAYLKRFVHAKQEFWVWVMAALVGSGLVADDRRTHALHIYFSRPVRRVDYMLGKGLALGLLLALVALVPSVLLLLADLGVEGVETPGSLGIRDVHVVGQASVREVGFGLLLRAVVAYQTVYIVPVTVLALALSSLVRHAGPAGAAILGYHFLSLVIVKVGVARAPDAASWLPLVSLHHALSRIGDGLYGLPLPAPGPSAASCGLVVCGVTLVSLWVLFRRLRVRTEGR
jgi:hypothetical protein